LLEPPNADKVCRDVDRESRRMGSEEIFDTGSQPALERLMSEVARWSSSEPLPELIWRDDDVTRLVPSLERFILLSDRRSVPIAFAAIPTQLTSGAAQAIRASKHCRVAMHGFTHLNHAPAGLPESEYPEGRAQADVLAELRNGRRLIKEKARERCLNMFVPPWGRFDPSYNPLLARAGIVGFSGSATSIRHAVPVQYDCHILTEHGRKGLDLPVILTRITRHLELRRAGALPRHTPIGLMTHHRTFGEELEAALDELLGVLQAAGFRFCDFEKIDSATAQAEVGLDTMAAPVGQSWGARSGLRRPQSGEPALSTAELLLRRTLPAVDEGFVGLERVLVEIGKMSPISVLRYTHLQACVSALPPGSRVLSAGCGKALSEVALAISNPEVSWLVVDVDPVRYQYAKDTAVSVDATNIRFAQADLNQPGGWDFGPVDAIIVSEVAMYLIDPGLTLAALQRYLKPSGTLTCIEPYLTEGDASLVERLKQHTQSVHGGFTHEQMLSFVSGMEVVQHSNCYWHAPDQLLKLLWEHMSGPHSQGMLDLMFAVARLDLTDARTSHRREATAVKVVARAPAGS
jgi:ubiquinone/menaquinone biosynthesis C-methylase UbiE